MGRSTLYVACSRDQGRSRESELVARLSGFTTIIQSSATRTAQWGSRMSKTSQAVLNDEVITPKQSSEENDNSALRTVRFAIPVHVVTVARTMTKKEIDWIETIG